VIALGSSNPKEEVIVGGCQIVEKAIMEVLSVFQGETSVFFVYYFLFLIFSASD
jgi:hypothetical protein